MDMTLQPVVDFASPIRNAPLPPRSNQRFARNEAPPAAGEPVVTQDGRVLRLRPIQPSDANALRRCFKRLPAEDIRRRFMHMLSDLPEPMAQRLCRLDPATEVAFVLVDDAAVPAEVRGVGRLFIDEASDSAEFSVLVERDWSRIGLGALLMRRLVATCRERGLAELWGYVLVENRPMLSLCHELGFTSHPLADEPGTARISLRL
jgi:GNAT superfamily N-acetyltransferase